MQKIHALRDLPDVEALEDAGLSVHKVTRPPNHRSVSRVMPAMMRTNLKGSKNGPDRGACLKWIATCRSTAPGRPGPGLVPAYL